MGVTDNPKLTDIEPYARKHGYDLVVLYALREDRQIFEVNTYGRGDELAKAAGIVGEQLGRLAADGLWPYLEGEQPRPAAPAEAEPCDCVVAFRPRPRQENEAPGQDGYTYSIDYCRTHARAFAVEREFDRQRNYLSAISKLLVVKGMVSAQAVTYAKKALRLDEREPA